MSSSSSGAEEALAAPVDAAAFDGAAAALARFLGGGLPAARFPTARPVALLTGGFASQELTY